MRSKPITAPVHMKHRVEDASHDLTSPDGIILTIDSRGEKSCTATVVINNISPWFVGYDIDKKCIFFNGKSVFAQLGLNIIGTAYDFHKNEGIAYVQVSIEALGPIAQDLLPLLKPGIKLGKLFAKDDRRRVRDPEYITRMFGRSDRSGNPLLSLGGLHGSTSLLLDKVDGRAVAYLSLKKGRVSYDSDIFRFLPTLAKATAKQYPVRDMLALHQIWIENGAKNVSENEILLVKTAPLHVRTVFAHVVNELLSPGYTHTTASILQPDTEASGDIYEVYGESKREITDIPLEFYTLEPYREHVFFHDRDQLQECIEDPNTLLQAFDSSPEPLSQQTSVFIVKGQQLKDLSPDDWITREHFYQEFPGISHGERQAMLVEHFIKHQASYPFLKAIEDETISSQGILLSRFFPSPIMKKLLLSDIVTRYLKGIYFQQPSCTHGDFFSNEDRALLNDLHKCGIPVFWVDKKACSILQYVQKPKRATGMFVPLSDIERYLTSTVFGVYGSNLVVGPFEEQLSELLQGILNLRERSSHILLNPKRPLALVTGGGPGAMELANRISKELGILSCANIADFRLKDGSIVNEQQQNPFVEAKMTYRLSELVERQAEFNLDFPIFVSGGIGTDFEYCLEEVRRKVGAIDPTPVLLFGEIEYWKDKITSRYQRNLKQGTIKGSEWISGCLFHVQTAREGLDIYRRYFEGTLPIGKDAPPQELGFVTSRQQE